MWEQHVTDGAAAGGAGLSTLYTVSQFEVLYIQLASLKYFIYG